VADSWAYIGSLFRRYHRLRRELKDWVGHGLKGFGLVRRLPITLQGAEEIGAAGGAEEFVVLDHGGGADAG